jgi:hypothetical protein
MQESDNINGNAKPSTINDDDDDTVKHKTHMQNSEIISTVLRRTTW